MKHKNILTISLIVVVITVGIFGYLKWKDHKQFLELVRTSASSTQKRNIERFLAPQLSFNPHLHQRVLAGIMDSAEAEVLEKIPVNDSEMMVRYRLSVLSESGARDLAARFLKSVSEKRMIGPEDLAELIKNDVDKNYPRQVLVGELRVFKAEGRWTVAPESIR